MLIISFDAVGDDEFERLAEYPAFSAFIKQAAVFRRVPTLFVSNTYPVHASVVTGVEPSVHGLVSNVGHFPMKHPEWNARDSAIRVKTLWQAAAEYGMDVAAVFWPVTAFSKTIRYNIPEVLPRPGKSQIIASMRAGSKCLQLKMILKYHKLLGDGSQPDRDYFAAACMADILHKRKRSPGLALLHLTAYDSICHRNGKGSAELETALESLDRNLARLLEAVGDDRDVIILSDHSQINVHKTITPNSFLAEAGLMRKENETWLQGESGCFIECCGGSAFFHPGSLPGSRIDELCENIKQSEGFRRFLTHEEMHGSGYAGAAFGFCAQAGYSYSAFGPGHIAEHGYPPDMPDYSVFYMARGFGLEPGSVTQGGSLLDIAPLAAKRLGLPQWAVDSSPRE